VSNQEYRAKLEQYSQDMAEMSRKKTLD